MKKRLFAVLLCFCLLVGLVPKAVFAAWTDTGKAIQLGASQIEGGQASSVYFGNYQQSSDGNGGYNIDPIKWRVLSNTDGKLFLLSDQNLDARRYNSSYGTITTWEKSPMRSWMNKDFLGAAFSKGEQAAIEETNVVNDDNPWYGTEGGNNTTDKIFLLSHDEACDTAYGFGSSYNTMGSDSGRISLNTDYNRIFKRAHRYSKGEGLWWLRTPGKEGSFVACVNYDGYIFQAGRSVDDDYVGIRPAFNLNLNSVLFTSAADNSGHINFGTAIPGYSGSEWKVTLKDGNDFSTGASVPGTTFLMEGYSNATLTINHATLSSLSSDYTDVTAALTDADGKLLYYGSINSSTSATESTVTIPAGLSEGTYTLSIYGEDRNEANRTDYATGTPYSVTLTVDNTPPTLSDGTATRESESTATVKFTSDEAGTYYYAVVESGDAEPTIKTTEVGTACDTTEQTISLDDLTGAGAKDIYIVVKDAAGNVSDTLKIEIPAYAALVQETTPSAEFSATSDNGGTLSIVDTSMKYSVDGGNTWNDITGESMEISGVTTENGIKVYKQGNGTTTSDSEVQTIDVTQAAQPTSIDKADCTTPQQNDGQITGVDTTMEYRLSGDSDWTAVTGNPVTGLTNGTYEIRVKASETVLASTAATVIIGAHTCAAQGEWQYDGTDHWKLCACGAKVEEAAHSGGTATCMVSAVCEVCGQPYGEKNPNNHTGAEAWITTETTHTKVYSCCQAVIETETAHTWENGKCSVCQYDCTHQGGTATCSQLAQCEICGSLYGSYDESNHKAADTWTQENGKHYHICEYGCNTHLDEADCSGGTATCTALAVCETCGQTYGVVNPDNHTREAVWTQTATTHSRAYDCCGAVVIAEEAHEWNDGVCSECGYECQHSGGEATCTEQATCEICNEKYGSLGAHKLSLTTKVEETCTTDGKEAYYTCEVCGKYFEDEAGNTEIANLDEWGIIPAAGHKSGTEWKSDADNHWKECTVAGCGVIIDDSKAAHTASDWITDTAATETTDGTKHKECTVCGYVLETGTIPATGTGHTHSYGESWKYDADNHWHECSCGAKADEANHVYDNEQDTTCNVCGYVWTVAPTSHSITVQTEGGGTASASPTSATAGTTINLTATPNSGYHFKEWVVVSGGMTISGDSFTMPDEDVTVKAVFEQDSTPSQYTVTFTTDYGTAPASMTVTEGTAITLPELEDDGDHVFVGWWIIDSSSPFVNLYSAGEEYTVRGNVTCIADWDEIVTLTAPFTTTVELGDYGVPGETVFTLEVVYVNVVEEGREDTYKDVTVSASVTTNGKGDYDGTMTFTGLSGQLRDMLTQGVYVQQVDDGEENWTYDDTVWYLILADEPEVSALTSTHDTAPEYEVQIFRATYEETEYGPVYGLDWENMDWDAPEAKMLFTNIYTAHDYTLKHDETDHWDECGCGDVQNREAHRYGEWTVTKEATKTESGEKEHTCTVCGYTETVEIEKLPHIHDYTLEHNETEHWDECGCGDVQNREAHRYGEWTVTKAATETENGKKEHTCTVCGYTQTAEIEKLPAAETNSHSGTGTDNTDTNAPSPRTGDNSNIVLWFSLMLVAGAALAGTAVYTHKKKRNR